MEDVEAIRSAPGGAIRSATSRVFVVLGAIISAAGSAAARQSDACTAHSSLPYAMSFSTSKGGLTLAAHRKGDLITVEARRDDGSHYTITRRNGYDLAYDTEDGRIEIAYDGISTNTPIAVAKPMLYDTTVTTFRSGKASRASYMSHLTYIGDENVAVGACAFHTLHYVRTEQNLDGSPWSWKLECWFSPDLNMTLRLIESRQWPGAPANRILETHATALTR